MRRRSANRYHHSCRSSAGKNFYKTFELKSLTFHSFLEKNENMDLIRWSDDGNSFIVLDEDEFAKTLIPDLFKHNNYASFVRQLNMYGFHKKVGLSDNSMRASERKNKSPSEYSNPYFRSGHPELLWLIQKPKSATATKGKGRKAGSEQNDEDADEYTKDTPNMDHHMQSRTQLAIDQGEAALSTEKFQSVQRELQAIRRQQQQIAGMMAQLKREHEQLYSQAATFQDQHTRHENSINAILTFLATFYNRSLNGNEGASGIAGLFANSVQQDPSQGNVVDVGDFAYEGLTNDMFGKPYKKTPLLLQGPPSDRAATISPNPESDIYRPRMTRRSSQALQQGATPVTTSEEAFNSNSETPLSHQQTAEAQNAEMMSIMKSQMARGIPATHAEFTDVLNVLENKDGNSPLTQLQRANALRQINATVGQGGDNALVNATPPAMPKDYTRNLQQSRASMESLARLQAEQDRKLQNLAQMMGPHSPTGSIPGFNDGQSVPPLDIDAFIDQDYYNISPVDGPGNDGTGNFDFIGADGAQGGFNANDLPNGDDGDDDDELFADVPPNGVTAVRHDDYPVNEDGTGRVESIASSEVTTPNTNSTADVNGYGPQTRSSTQGRRMSGELEKSPGKRRKRNV